MPRYEELDWTGLDFSREQFNEIMSVDREQWKQEILLHEELFIRLYDRLPKEMLFKKELLLSGLWRSAEKWELSGECSDKRVVSRAVRSAGFSTIYEPGRSLDPDLCFGALPEARPV